VRPAGPIRVVLRAHGVPTAGTAANEEAEALGHQPFLSDGVRTQIAFLLHVRPHGV
jgi:hypothetical protein